MDSGHRNVSVNANTCVVVDGGGVLPAHAGPILVAPEVGVLTPRDGHLVPELCPESVEGLSLSHGQGNLDPLHQDLGKRGVNIKLTTRLTNLDVFRMSEVSRVEDGFIVRITAPQQHPAS